MRIFISLDKARITNYVYGQKLFMLKYVAPHKWQMPCR